MDPVESTVSDQTPLQTYGVVPPRNKKNKKGLFIILAVVVAAIAAFAFTRSPDESASETKTATPTQAIQDINVTEEPSVTPEPTEAEVKKASGPLIQVQNGSGAEGVAGKMKTALEDAGYESIETGNAENYEFESVTLRAKKASLPTAEKIKTQLTDYTFVDGVATLSDDSLFDIVVVVGK